MNKNLYLIVNTFCIIHYTPYPPNNQKIAYHISQWYATRLYISYKTLMSFGYIKDGIATSVHLRPSVIRLSYAVLNVPCFTDTFPSPSRWRKLRRSALRMTCAKCFTKSSCTNGFSPNPSFQMDTP